MLRCHECDLLSGLEGGWQIPLPLPGLTRHLCKHEPKAAALMPLKHAAGAVDR